MQETQLKSYRQRLEKIFHIHMQVKHKKSNSWRNTLARKMFSLLLHRDCTWRKNTREENLNIAFVESFHGAFMRCLLQTQKTISNVMLLSYHYETQSQTWSWEFWDVMRRNRQRFTTVQKFGVGFWKKLFCSPRRHVFDQKCSKNSKIMKYYYNSHFCLNVI